MSSYSYRSGGYRRESEVELGSGDRSPAKPPSCDVAMKVWCLGRVIHCCS